MLPAKSYFVWDAQGAAAWYRTDVKSTAVSPCQAPDNPVCCIAQWHITCGGIIVSLAAASGLLWVCVDPLQASSLCKHERAPHAAWLPVAGFVASCCAVVTALCLRAAFIQQNSELGLPVQLSQYEAALASEQGAAHGFAESLQRHLSIRAGSRISIQTNQHESHLISGIFGTVLN